MQGPSTYTSTKSFKQAFLKNLLLSLHARTGTSTGTCFAAMNLQERTRAVKSSADVAMAAARGAGGGGGARWPKAILAAAADQAAGTPAPSPSPSPSSGACKVRRCRRIVRRCCHKKRGCSAAAAAAARRSGTTSGDVARRLVRRRTMALREVIPGGQGAIDEASLLREAMDYVVHLRAQVDVLRRVSEAVETSSFLRDSWSQCALK